MVLDIAVCAIIIGSMVQGFRHGLLRSFIHTAGWLVSLASGFLFGPKLHAFLADNTGIYDFLYTRINDKAGSALSLEELQQSLPSIMQEAFTGLSDSLSGSVADSFANLALCMISFFIIAFCVRAAFHIILALFSREKNDGIAGFVDGAAGLLFGFIKSILYTFIILALLLPAASLVSAEGAAFITDSLAQSKIASELYNNNLLLLMVNDLL